MKTIRYILVASLGFGCATGPQLATKDPQVAGKNYTVEAQTILARKVLREGNRRCPNTSREMDSKTWREAVDFGTTCAAREKWSNLEFVGQYMADRFPTAPWGFYFLSLAADARGDMGRAFWMLEQAGEKDKTMALFPYQRGRIYLKNGETDSAVVEFEKAIKLDSNLYEADLFLGQIRLRSGNLAAAERSFRNVLKYEPFHRDALVGAARCLVVNGDAKLALDFLERVIAKDKRDLEARYERAQILETHFQKHEEALAEYLALRTVGDGKFQLNKRIEDLEKVIKVKKAEADRKVASTKSGGGK